MLRIVKAMISAAVPLLAVAMLAAGVRAQATAPAAESKPVTVLGAVSSWRVHLTHKPPVIALDEGLKPILLPQKWLNSETAEPAAGWTQSDFDDGGWVRGPARLPCWTPYISRVCLRGRFTVSDPAKVRGLSLTLGFHGGAVVTLNGLELVRGHLAKEGGAAALAESYPREASAPAKAGDGSGGKPAADPRERRLDGIAIPADKLRPGVNVLAIEIVRAPYDQAVEELKQVSKDGDNPYAIGWNTCELTGVQLTATGPDGLTPNGDRPPGLQVWNSDVLATDWDVDFGDPNESLRPITLVGARNGWYSGKVVLGSPRAIAHLKAVPGELKAEQGGTIAASAVKVRYGLRWGDDTCYITASPYVAEVKPLAALAEAPPEEFPVLLNSARRYVHRPLPTEAAIVPVWVTVKIPAGAAPGTYRGQVTLTAEGEPPIAVPLVVQVASWTLPDPQDYRTWVELIQSPDTLAVEYGVPLWSERHWAMIARSFEYLNQVGSRVLYVPLLAHSNLGNEESMVRWIEKGGDQFDFDFSIMEKYLDLARKHMGTPKLVIFNVWDVYLIPKENAAESGGYGGHRRMVNSFDKEQASKLGTGPLVTVIDPKTGRTENAYLPRYEAAPSKALWQRLFAELRVRMKNRGLEGAMMLGTVTDAWPTKSDVQFFKDIAADLSWACEGHNGFEPGQLLQGLAKVSYQTRVWSTKFADEVQTHGATWGKDRLYGWQRPDLVADFERNGGLESYPNTRWRQFAESNITGGQRGVGRLGGDFWDAVKDKNGRRKGTVTFRFPESLWMNLNIVNPVLAPGPDGPVATQHYEMFREGVQECEARIFIEQALTDAALRARLGPELAARAEQTLDERMPILWHSLSNLALIGSRWGDARLWRWTPGVAGHYWFLGSRWQERSLRLYELAGQVEERLAAK